MSAIVLLVSFVVPVILWRLVRAFSARSRALAQVAGPPRESWLNGNVGHLFHDALEYNLKLAKDYGGAVRMYEMFGKPALYVSDPVALQHILGKEQHAYGVTDAFIHSNLLMFGEGLLGTSGEQHKKQRKMLNPVFSASNMRELLPVIQPIADEMASVFLQQVPEDGSTVELDVMPWLSRGAQEYMSQACFGYTFNALDLNKRNEYSEAARRYTPAALRVSYLRPFLPFIVRRFPLSWRNKMVEWFPSKDFKDFAYILDVMHKTSQRIYAEKKASIGHSAGERDLQNAQRSEGDMGPLMKGKDIMSILLKANASSNEADRMTDSELIGQMSTLLFAGFETTTYAISRILWVLASRPEAQARLRSEIRDAKRRLLSEGSFANDRWEDVALSYDQLMALPYLDAIIRETLRVHPPSSVHFRETKEPTSLPLHTPVRSVEGNAVSTIPLEANTTILVSIIASNRNTAIWGEDAAEWKPERWLAGSDAASKADSVGVDGGVRYPGVYSSMMTFLGGPRGCIGFKFSEMEAKQVLATLLPRMHFSLPTATDEQGNRKEIYWNMSGPQIPTVRPPFGDGVSAQVPLDIRRVKPKDFI